MSNKLEATFHGATPEQVAVAMSGEVDPPRACGPVPGPTGGVTCLVHRRVWGERGCAWAVNAADRVVAAGDGEIERLRESGDRWLRLWEAAEARAEVAEAERDDLRRQVAAVRALVDEWSRATTDSDQRPENFARGYASGLHAAADELRALSSAAAVREPDRDDCKGQPESEVCATHGGGWVYADDGVTVLPRCEAADMYPATDDAALASAAAVRDPADPAPSEPVAETLNPCPATNPIHGHRHGTPCAKMAGHDGAHVDSFEGGCDAWEAADHAQTQTGTDEAEGEFDDGAPEKRPFHAPAPAAREGGEGE